MSKASQPGWDNMGIQFFFDWKDSSAVSQDEYDQFILNQLLPHFDSAKIPPPMRSFVPGAVPPSNTFLFFVGNVQPREQVSMPYDGYLQADVLRDVKHRNMETIYMVAIFGSWLSRFGWPEKLDNALKSKKGIGYLGMTYAVNIKTLQAYQQFTQNLSLSPR